MSFDQNAKYQPGREKTPHHVTPARVMDAVARVFAGGSAKYGYFNWRLTGVDAQTYYSASRRHIEAWFDGEDADPESGEHHLAHAIACCMILLDAIDHDRFADNRPHNAMCMKAVLASDRPCDTEDICPEC